MEPCFNEGPARFDAATETLGIVDCAASLQRDDGATRIFPVALFERSLCRLEF